MRVVVDCNVLVSAARTGGACGGMIVEAMSRHETVLSDAIVDEYEMVAGRPTHARYRDVLNIIVWGVDDHGVTGARGTRLDVVARITRPAIGGKAVSPPCLFIGVVGLADGADAFACLSGHVQPIVAMNCPLPVESGAERQAFATLRKTLTILRREFDKETFTLERPLFETGTQYGPCLPDFIIQARPEAWEGWESVRFMIEVMGFGDADYRRRKEETHRAMRELGTLCVMEADRFGTREGLASEGTGVTDRVRAVLRRRMAEHRDRTHMAGPNV